jgi:hypothetical protein
MAKPQLKSNPHLGRIFDELDAYREFCVEYGYRFDEATLYDMKAYVYQQFTKFAGNKNFKDQWADDARRLNLSI